MDTAQLRRELAGSVRLLWRKERWLWSGAVIALAGFALWVGATGAALTYGADVAGVSLSVTDWSTTTTVVLGVVTVLWLLAPAALVTYLVDDYLTNVSGNVHHHYRVQHPTTLVVPPLSVFLAAVAAAVAVGDVPAVLAAALVAAGLLVLIRTVAYSYRVFSGAVPLVTQVALFVSLVVVAVAVLAGAATIAGRRAFVAATARGVGDLLGTDAVVSVLTGTTTVGPVTVSTLLGLAAGLPVGLAVGYVLVQSVAGLVARLRSPDVPRSQLRTGQRYPQFARPTTASADSTPTGREGTDDGTADTDAGSSGADAAATADAGTAGGESTTADRGQTGDDTAATSERAETASESASDDVSHTKVYTAPDDGDFDADIPGIDETPETGDDGRDQPTAVDDGTGTDSGDGYRCPTCAESFEPDTSFAYCPTCGEELQPE